MSPQLVNVVESAATVTGLVDIAAAVETRLHEAETRNHDYSVSCSA